MGKVWDGVPAGELPVAFDPETWRLAMAVLKPGGRLLAFGGTRTWHRLACAIEDAGFVYEDTIAWVFGQGLVLSKTRLKPGWSPIVMARAPGPALDLNIDACRVAGGERLFREGEYKDTANAVYSGRMDDSLRGGSRAAGTTNIGRWPADLIHDNSPDILEQFPDSPEQLAAGRHDGAPKSSQVYGTMRQVSEHEPRGDSGSAARFFNACEWTDEERELRIVYNAKCKASDRQGSKHPTLKPISLLRHLVRLVTHPGERILDCFGGSGTTGEAAFLEGRHATLMEQEPEYVIDCNLRMLSAELRASRSA